MSFRIVYDFLSAEPWARLLRTPEKIADELGSFANPQIVLEVGTAEAYNLRQLVTQGILSSAVGYDISPRRLHLARQRIEAEGLADKVYLCRGDGRQLPFADDAVDVTLLPQVLEHLPTRRGVIDLLVESRRVSRQGLLVSLPLRDASHPLIRWSKYLDPDHLHGLLRKGNGWMYDSDKVERLFGEIGFRYERSEENDEFYLLR